MKIVFIVLILLVMDIVIFSATYGVTKRYIQEQRIISDNIETLITSVESKNYSDVWVAVDYSSSSESSDFVHEYCSIFLDKKTGQRIVVPDSLYLYYYPDDDYLEL